LSSQNSTIDYKKTLLAPEPRGKAPHDPLTGGFGQGVMVGFTPESY